MHVVPLKSSLYLCLGALIEKNQKLLEKKIAEKYEDAEVSIIWHDELSGSAINNNMLAHKYQFGYMGDMPCIINLYNSYTDVGYSSYLLALDGKGINGLNQAIYSGSVVKTKI